MGIPVGFWLGGWLQTKWAKLRKRFTELEEEGVVVAEVRGVAASEDEDLVLPNPASRVIGAGHGDVSSALLEGPLHADVVGEDPEGVQVVLGQQLGGIRQGLGLLQPSEHVVYFPDGHDRVSRDRRGLSARLFDFLPRNWRRLS